MTSVLIVDDHPIVHQGCRMLLQDLGIERIVSEPDVVRGYRAFFRCRPDIVLVDLTMQNEGLAGLSLISRIHMTDSTARMLVLSMHNDPSVALRALDAGAMSYVLKDRSSVELVNALQAMMRDEPYVDATLAGAVEALRKAESARGVLTRRETEVLSMLARGMSHDAIARALGTNYRAIANACALMRRKLKIGSLAELMRHATLAYPPQPNE